MAFDDHTAIHQCAGSSARRRQSLGSALTLPWRSHSRGPAACKLVSHCAFAGSRRQRSSSSASRRPRLPSGAPAGTAALPTPPALPRRHCPTRQTLNPKTLPGRSAYAGAQSSRDADGAAAAAAADAGATAGRGAGEREAPGWAKWPLTEVGRDLGDALWGGERICLT